MSTGQKKADERLEEYNRLLDKYGEERVIIKTNTDYIKRIEHQNKLRKREENE